MRHVLVMAVALLGTLLVGVALSACGAQDGGADRAPPDRRADVPVPAPEDPALRGEEDPVGGVMDEAPAPESPATVPESVQVFFATDRARFLPTVASYLGLFQTALVVLLVGWILLRFLKRALREEFRRHLLVLRVVWVLLLLALAVDAAYTALSTSQAHARLSLLFGGERALPLGGDADAGLDDVLTLGVCQVSIPPQHVLGEVERPSPWRGDFFEDPERHMVVLSLDPQRESVFFDDMDAVIRGSEARDAFVFVHGFNVSFEEALLRTGQIAYDLQFEGAAICYSWPSQGDVTRYMVDEANVGWTVPHLFRFLLAVREQTHARKIHLIAHSMGNRALTGALARIALERRGQDPLFNEIVLAAPDIDADTFRRFIAPSILSAGKRVTLYASSKDTALQISREIHGSPRAGESGEGIVLVDGMDTVDVSQVSGSHSYIGDSNRVLGDLGLVLGQGRRLVDGPGVRERWSNTLRFWILQELGR